MSVLVAVLGLAGAGAHAARERVTDFALLDAHGVFHQLSRYQHRRALVVMAHDPDCVTMPESLAALGRARDAAQKTPGENAQETPQGVDFLLIDAGGRGRVGLQALGLDFPVLEDEGGLVSAALGLTQAGETLVLNPRRLALYYRGPAGEPLRAMLARITTEAITRDTLSLPMPGGCPLAYPAWQTLRDEPPDYASEVAPIILRNCSGCHRQGGVGPFALDSHLMVLGWSPMIREVLLNRRMPPMQADPHYRHSADARYLSPQETARLVAWIDAGAPRGDGTPDPLEATAAIAAPAAAVPSATPATEGIAESAGSTTGTPPPRWLLGEPDHIVAAPPQPVAATGVMDYLYAEVELGFTEDRWLRAVQYLPGDESVLHHLMTFVTPPGEDFWGGERQQRSEPRRFVAGYIPGPPQAVEFPPGTGVHIPAGHKLSMQFHYVTNGQSTVDETRLGLYFYDKQHAGAHEEQPLKELLTLPLSADFVLPPHDPDHALEASHRFTEAAVITGLRPRMSFRGKRMRFAIEKEDGTREVFFSIPAYNYGWQPHYRLSRPLLVPAGSKIWVEGAFDNSVSNPNNPAPEREVRFGVESWEEMFTGYLVYYHP